MAYTSNTSYRSGMNAARAALLGFAGVILAGALLLMLPACSRDGALGPIDALFTATSATCVTGLVVVDTGTRLTPLGQAVVLLLIQVGGIGIMTLSAFTLLMLGRRSSLAVSDALSGQYLRSHRIRISTLLRGTLMITLACEAAGAVLLLLRWRGDFPDAGAAVWSSIFHAVSAFCNAGFSLFPDSLCRYAADPAVNAVIGILVVGGGLGFFVLTELTDRAAVRRGRRRRRLSFHTKVVLTMSALLLVGGALFFYLLERSSSMAGLPAGEAALRSLFQSVTARTAGFNTVEVHSLSSASLFTLVLLMFCGGAPGSMAGGVKVTTLGVILIVVVSRLRGARRPSLFGRSLGRANLERALALLIIAAVLVGLMTMLLLVTELGGISHPESRGKFLDLAFECVSAFGTVGLSAGVTPDLSPAGRILITLLMFVGRLGPLTLVAAMERRRRAPAYAYPEEELMIG